MILTPSAFKGLYKLESMDDSQVLNAIITANQNLVRLLKRREEFLLQTPVTEQVVKFGTWYPLSKDLSINIKKEDFEIYEYDANYTKYDLQDKVTSVETIDLPQPNGTVVKLKYSEELPTASDRQVVLRFNKARISCYSDDLIDNMRRWLALMTFNILNKDVLLYLRQKGISSWNLNGVNVDISASDFEELKTANEEEMKDIYSRFFPLVIERTRTNSQWLGRGNGPGGRLVPGRRL